MIKKILIANRGEIAERIIRTCKKLAIETVAIYSEVDEGLNYVQMADEAYSLGEASVNESYLNIEKIIMIAKKAKVDAIHPGYGFLSENGDFAYACEREEIIFIGPKADVLEKMGDKIFARKLMKDNDIPIIPGSVGRVNNVTEAIDIANELNYPVMLKASAGGGGIGMETVHTDEALEKVFENNAKRAEMFFGESSMFIEKLIPNARHIEVQILADKHGHVVHLFERECSIQRRNQKIVEEAPSLSISQKIKEKMFQASLEIAKALQYTGVGTIEFLVDEEENFFFLEMNTRIQVEHPVTEEITGVDIVKQQIDIASGKPLQLQQKDISQKGHAVEMRIYAEHPETFFPSPGKITKMKIPGGQNIRHELTYQEGDEVTHFYDPMIGKLIVHGKTREDTLLKLRESLQEYEIEGIHTNISVLKFIIEHEDFNQGHIFTNFITKNYLS